MPTAEVEYIREDGIRVRVKRSTKRTRTVNAAWREGVAVVSIPARLSRKEEQHWVDTMLVKLMSKRKPLPAGDDELLRRTQMLSARYLDGRARPLSVRWVSNQHRRWGSATASEGTIRLSDRLREMPEWVVDFVLVHELAHLLADDGHGPQFKALEARYPRRVEAQAFLNGVTWASDREGEVEF
ncbi:M48 metallopeptidase family protein [Galactobacter caseinivorans]|uniref:M48 family peptidase n=1 Tax=Galactobacter caseinivorans TaxID=2676123 RepID=A0A496PM77_9MICC|nr:M48 family metallopeptidase [Galactobacter caseinivorans]RKW71623.1 M48 family peptidase [Galactobacter caseinivorans]